MKKVIDVILLIRSTNICKLQSVLSKSITIKSMIVLTMYFNRVKNIKNLIIK